MKNKINLLNTIAKNIRYYRQQRNLSQEELADICNLHRTYIGSIERGERNITIMTLEKIARGLEINECQLITARDVNIK